MKYVKAKRYLQLMAAKYPDCEWQVVRLAPHNWVVRGRDGAEEKDYTEIDCAINI